MPTSPADDPLSRILMRLERRRRAVVLGRGLGRTLAIAAFGGLLGIGLDVLFFLPQPARWSIWGAWLGSIGVSLAMAASRAYARPADLLALASRAERDDPSSAPLEALTAAVSLGRNPHGSSALIAALAEQAAGLMGGIDPRRIVPGRRAVGRLAIGSTLLALLVAPAFVAPDGPARTGVRRFLSPWANLGRPGAHAITVEPGDARAAIGSRPTIRVAARGGGDAVTASPPDEAWIEWRDADAAGPPHRLAMGGEPGRFSATMPRLKGAVAYRALVGPGAGSSSGWWHPDRETSASPWYRLEAVEPPKVVTLRATVEPPSYTKLPPATIAIVDGPATIAAWQDSRVVLDVSADAPIRSLSVDLEADGDGAKAPRVTPHAGAIAVDRRSAVVALNAEASGTLAISLVDEDGIAGVSETLHRLAIRVDSPPTVSVEELDRVSSEEQRRNKSTVRDESIEARPDDVVRFEVAARDDVAVASVELRCEVERAERPEGEEREGQRPPIPTSAMLTPPGLGTSRVRGEAALNLEPLALNPGDRLTYRVRVADNRPSPRGPNVAWSEPRSIAIVRRADTLAQRRRDAARAAVQAQLDAVRRATAKLRQEAERLRYAADAARQGSGPWDAARQRALADREDESGRLIDDIGRLATALEARGDPRGRPDPEADFHALAPAAREAAAREGESSRAALGEARRARPQGAEAAAKRLDALRQADAHLAALASRLDELQARFDATRPRGKSRQGGDGQKSDLASKESSPGAGEAGDRGQGPGENKEGDGGKPGESSGGGGAAAMAGKPRPGPAGQTGEPGSGPAAPTGYPALHEEAEPMPDAGAGDLAALREALRTRDGRAWAELPGQLRSRILRMPQVRFRDEYARQIERYYRALAEPETAGGGRADE